MSLSRIRSGFFIPLLVGVLFFLPADGLSQRTMGVLWEAPDNSEAAVQQLNRLRRLGISILEIGRPLPDRIRREADSLGFDLYVQVPVRYPVAETFSDPDSALIATYRQYISDFYDTGTDAFGVFEYGQSNSRSFPDVASPFINQLDEAFDAPLYFKDWDYAPQPVDSLVDFRIVRVDVDRDFRERPDSLFTGIGAYLYRPAPGLEHSVAPLKWFLEKTSVDTSAKLFFSANWLLSFLNRHPGIEPILSEYAHHPDPVFPLPRETLPGSGSHSSIVLILLFVWGSFALTYSYVPTYRRSLFRYFFSHRFFVEDVMKRHIRSGLTGLAILVQHAIMGGMFLYICAVHWFSPTGNEVIATHLPVLKLFGRGYYAYFFTGTALTLLVEMFCVLWLYLVNRRLKYLGQVSVLYSWSLHANLLVITVLLTLMRAGSDSFLFHLLLMLFPAVFIASFPLTAFDTGLYIRRYKGLYTIGTIGIYSALIAGGAVWVLTESYLLNIFRLASAMP